MRPEVRDQWKELLEAEGRPATSKNAPEPILGARKILFIATFGTAGVALAVPLAINIVTFTAGLLHEGVTTIQALLAR